RRLMPQYQLDKADIVLTLDIDLLGTHPEAVRYTREFMAKRRSEHGNRLYVVEPHPTITGAMADHRLSLPASHVRNYLVAVLNKVGETLPVPESLRASLRRLHPAGSFPPHWIDDIASELIRNRSKCLVMVGARQGPLTELVAYFNNLLGNSDATVV